MRMYVSGSFCERHNFYVTIFDRNIYKVMPVFSFLASSLQLRFDAPRGKISTYEEEILNSCTVFLPSNAPLFAGVYSLKQLHIHISSGRSHDG